MKHVRTFSHQICKTIFTFFCIFVLSNCHTSKTQMVNQEGIHEIPKLDYEKLPHRDVERLWFAGKYIWFYPHSGTSIEIWTDKKIKTLRLREIPRFYCPQPPSPIFKPGKDGLIEGIAIGRSRRDCTPYPNWYRNRRLGFNGTRVTRHHVIITSGKNRYTYSFDGTLKGYEIIDPAKTSWDPENSSWNVKEGKLFYDNKRIATRKDHFGISGNWVIVKYSDDSRFSFYSRKGGELKRTFDKPPPQYFNSKGTNYRIAGKQGYDIRGMMNGAYVEKNRRTQFWFGNEVIDLRPPKGKFCYIKNETKKCISDPKGYLRHIIENEYYRLYLGRWNDFYIEKLN